MSTYGKTVYNPYEQSSQWVEQIKVYMLELTASYLFILPKVHSSLETSIKFYCPYSIPL